MGGLVTLITKDKIDIDVVTSPTNIIITMSTAIGRCDTCKHQHICILLLGCVTYRFMEFIPMLVHLDGTEEEIHVSH